MDKLQKERDYLASLNKTAELWYENEIDIHQASNLAKAIEKEMKAIQGWLKQSAPAPGLAMKAAEKANNLMEGLLKTMEIK